MPWKLGVRRSAVARTPSAKSAVPCEAVLLGLLAVGRGADACRQVASHRLADAGHRERRRRRDLGGQRAAPRRRCRRLHEPVEQADAVGLLAAEPRARVQHLEGPLLADDGGQRDGEAEAVVEAEAGEVGAHPASVERRPGSRPTAPGPARRRWPRPAPPPRPASGARTGARPRRRGGAPAGRPAAPIRSAPGRRRRRRSACPRSRARWPGSAGRRRAARRRRRATAISARSK